MKFYIQKDKNPVKSHLAITPAQMDTAREQGVPITPNNINPDLIQDGTTNPQFEIELERQRGVDIAELWQDAETSRKRLSKVKKIQTLKQQQQQQKQSQQQKTE